MMNTTPTEVNDLALRERHLERQALPACRSATVVQCLKDYSLDPVVMVTTASKDASLPIRASDIAALKKRIFELVDIRQSQYPLSTELEHLIELYEQFLLNEHTARYRLLVSPAHRAWLRRIVMLVVVRAIMEMKYERVTTEGQTAFVDTWVAGEMGRLMLLRTLPGMVAQLIHHIVREPDQAQEMIEQLYRSIDIRMKGCLLDSPEPLPPLPQGPSLLLALPPNEEQRDE